LACILIENADKVSIETVADIIRYKASKIKSKKDDEHQKRIEGFKALPSSIIQILIHVGKLPLYMLQMAIPAMGYTKYGFGACCLTALGGQGSINTTSPHN
jgi:hypothetical protein